MEYTVKVADMATGLILANSRRLYLPLDGVDSSSGGITVAVGKAFSGNMTMVVSDHYINKFSAFCALRNQ